MVLAFEDMKVSFLFRPLVGGTETCSLVVFGESEHDRSSAGRETLVGQGTKAWKLRTCSFQDLGRSPVLAGECIGECAGGVVGP